MSMKIITGSTGTTHVTSNNDGEFNLGIFGEGIVVLPNGDRLAASLVDNNTVRIGDGDIVAQGRHGLIEPGTSEDVTISTGSIDLKRNDLIVVRYQLDTNTGYESMALTVIEGTPSADDPRDPAYNVGDIRTGATLVDFPLYRVKIVNVSITEIEPLFVGMDSSLYESFGGLKLRRLNSEEEYNNLPSRDPNTIYVWKA